MQTNTEEWRDVALGSQPAWEWRSEIIAKFIRPTDTVLDIGAGDQKLRRFVPPGCGYVPVDCVDDLPGTFLVDFNKEFRLPEAPFDVIVCAGFLEYLNDIPQFFTSLSKEAPGKYVLFTYLLDDVKATRSTMKAHNDLTDHNDVLELTRTYFSHIDVLAFRNRTVFLGGSLRQDAAGKSENRRSLNELLQQNSSSGKIRSWVRRYF